MNVSDTENIAGFLDGNILVVVEDRGLTRISEVTIDDQVMVYDPATGCPRFSTVTAKGMRTIPASDQMLWSFNNGVQLKMSRPTAVETLDGRKNGEEICRDDKIVIRELFSLPFAASTTTGLKGLKEESSDGYFYRLETEDAQMYFAGSPGKELGVVGTGEKGLVCVHQE